MFKTALLANFLIVSFAFRASHNSHSPKSAMLSKLFGKKEVAREVTGEQKRCDDTPVNILDRKTAALFGMYVADSVAMPVHWMYNLNQLKRDYGRITGYVKPQEKFEGSILNLSNTGGGGRGTDEGDIVGSVILHGKKKYWLRGGNYHYHLGLEAGENTLEAQLCRVLTRSILTTSGVSAFSSTSDLSSIAPLSPSLSIDHFTTEYVDFMRTPGSHNDTYASTAHRMFFANLVKGLPPSQCADNDGHNTDAIDALTLTLPVIIAYAEAERSVRNKKVHEIIAVTRKSRAVLSYAEQYADILVAVLHGTPLRSAIDAHDPSGSIRRTAARCQQTDNDPMVACYIDSAFPALLVFAYEYADSLEEAILASANAGGENVARGALLGALLGAQHGLSSFPEWARAGLKNKDEVMQEISALVALSELQPQSHSSH